MSGLLDAPDGLDYQGRRDLVDLLHAHRLDDVPLKPAALIGVAHDAALFQVTPQPKGIGQDVALRRLLADLFTTAPRGLLCFAKAHFRKVAEKDICHATGNAQAQNETLSS